MGEDLFRKEALERLSSPEQLDKLLIIVKIKGWVALFCLIGLTAAILVWSFLGSIPITSEGIGILLDPRGLRGIYTKSSGRVSSILARTGVAVKKGDILVVLENLDLENKIKDLSHQLSMLRTTLKNEERLYLEEKKGKEESLQKQIELQNLILENQKGKLAILERQLKEVSGAEQLEIEKEILEQRNVIEQQLITLDTLNSQRGISKPSERLTTLKNELAQMEAKRVSLSEMAGHLVLIAPTDGNVIEIDVMLGEEISSGKSVAWLQSDVEKGKTLPFYCFVSIDEGEKINPGMSAKISLLAIDSQKYGQMIGTVDRILPYAASLSTQQLAGIPSSVIREFLHVGQSSMLVVVHPIPDLSTPTGYKWTTKTGPQEEIQPGAIGTAIITLETKKPIDYALPFFQK